MEESTGSPISFNPGDPVKIVGEAAQAAVGADRVVVVGDTAVQVDTDEVKVVVAPDVPVSTNAVFSPTELEKDSES
jgi:hypothetical protein